MVLCTIRLMAVPRQANSPVYQAPFPVVLGQTIQALAVKPGRTPSAVTTFEISADEHPVITTDVVTYKAKVGQAFSATFAATGPVSGWCVTGRLGESYRSWEGVTFNPPQHISWLSIDQNGVLSGTPRQVGVYPVLVTASNVDIQNKQVDTRSALCDTRMVVITVEK